MNCPTKWRLQRRKFIFKGAVRVSLSEAIYHQPPVPSVSLFNSLVCLLVEVVVHMGFIMESQLYQPRYYQSKQLVIVPTSTYTVILPFVCVPASLMSISLLPLFQRGEESELELDFAQ